MFHATYHQLESFQNQYRYKKCLYRCNCYRSNQASNRNGHYGDHVLSIYRRAFHVSALYVKVNSSRLIIPRVEPIEVISEHNMESRQVPDLTPRETQVDVSYINDCCGLSLSAEEICKLLKRMSYFASPSSASKDVVDISIPPTRADVLHQCDIMEDVAIAYGFNNLPKYFPSKSGTIAQPLMVNKLGDIVRLEAAMAGWSEVMPLILCSHDENFAWLNREDDGETAVKLANPKTAEYQVVRTTLLPGLLKTIRENKHHSVPIKIFEVSDVAFKDMSLERKSRNERHFAAAWYGKTSGFEVVHGLMDRIMLMLKSAFITSEEGLEGRGADESAYWIEEINGKTLS